ncbi:hypothetical protein B296_00001120 [Ensete ventricosum]|uniref:Uncharacterized protein n=1 Tax=Ensete ventricosum TaxID=4639 RepID=A0A426ZP22_ENSVE|nr:hypothetical protein B296_00001120 [Ensete ventricosum]
MVEDLPQPSSAQLVALTGCVFGRVPRGRDHPDSGLVHGVLCKNPGGYYLIARVGFRVSGAPSNNKGWKSSYLFVSGLVWGFRLDWLTHPIGNAPPYLSEKEFVLVDRLKGILSSLRAIKEMTELWLVKAGLSPTSRGIVILPCFSFSSCLLTCKSGCRSDGSRRVARDAKGVDDPARRPKKVKVLTRRHKSRHDEGESRSRSKGKEPTASLEELETPAESDEGGASLVHHHPRSMKDLFKTKVHKDDAGYYTLHMSDLGHQDPDKEMKARWRGLKKSTKIWNDSLAAEEFERGLLHPQLAQELYTLPSEVLLARAAKEMVLLDALKSGRGPEAVAKAEERASELEQELGKTKRERDEALQRLEASEKELTEVRSNLAEIQRLLKEARVRARKMDDELLQSMKALGSARAELPKQAVDHYKESVDFKEGLKWMGRVTYKYGYRVALARFHALHLDSEVEDSDAKHRSEPNHPQPTEEVTTARLTPNHFWRMITDPGFPSPAFNPAPFVITAEAFLGLTNQVQALAGMMQTIVPYLP